MELVAALGAASSAAQVLVSIIEITMDIKALCEAINSADSTLLSILSLLSTMRAALERIDDLMRTVEHDEQLREDLGVACQASQMQIEILHRQISKLTVKRKRMGQLRLRSKISIVCNSSGMEICMTRLDRQATALNLLISILTSKTVLEQKQLLQRSNTRKMFKQVAEDAVSVKLDEKDEDFNVAPALPDKSSFGSKLTKSFTFDSEVAKSKSYSRTLRGMFRRHTQPTMSSEEAHDPDGDTLVEESNDVPQHIDLQHCRRLLAVSGSAADNNEILGRMQVLSSTYLNIRNLDVGTDVFNDDSLAEFKDVSVILFTVSPAAYALSTGTDTFDDDLSAFLRIGEDYYLSRAPIILYVDTTGLREGSYAPALTSIFSEIESEASDAEAVTLIQHRFVSSGKMASRPGRLYRMSGQRRDVAARQIMEVMAGIDQDRGNKWGGLS